MIKINLLPVREKARAENVRRQITLGVLVIVLAVAAMLFAYAQKSHQLGEKRVEKARKEARLAKLKKEVGDLNKIKKEKNALEKRKNAIGRLNINRLNVVKVLDKLSAAKPDALFFTKLEQRNSGAPWQDFSVIVEGVATDNEVIAQYMRNLQKIPMFKMVDLDYTKAKTYPKEIGTFQQFRLNIAVSQPSSTSLKTTTGEKKRKG